MNVTNTDLLNNRYKYSIDVLEQNIVKNHLDEKIGNTNANTRVLREIHIRFRY